jgi:hypothetical protein
MGDRYGLEVELRMFKGKRKELRIWLKQMG